jgi:hypothetical protein
MKSAPFFQQTVFLTSGSIAIAIRNECLPACPKILIAQRSLLTDNFSLSRPVE